VKDVCGMGFEHHCAHGGDIAGQLVVASPLYKQHYDLQTGACLEDTAEQVEVYGVRLEGDSVLIAR